MNWTYVQTTFIPCTTLLPPRSPFWTPGLSRIARGHLYQGLPKSLINELGRVIHTWTSSPRDGINSKYITVVNLKICACRVFIQTYSCTYSYIWLMLRGASQKQERKETWPTLQPWFHGDGVHLWVVVQGTPVSRWFWAWWNRDS